MQQRAQHRLPGQGDGPRPPGPPVHEQRRGQPAGGGFQVALHAAHLAREPEVRQRFSAQLASSTRGAFT